MQSTGLSEDQSEAAQKSLEDYAAGRPISVSLPILTRPDTVYFVTCCKDDFPIKIGVAANVQKRLEALQVSLPYRVLLLATAPGGLARERKLHILFRGSKLYGEWFQRTPELMETVQFYARRSANG